ncbi:MEI5 protein [Colletotrichum truncatum]|uniref:MEI5 protein n=1 Tax=Colletotrichum truncatum TaxID=5467 RepID=A0ACC3YT95_COLTU|nr:MEI5 protein [Colletotrichum truncatum]KAF6799076.1 MEI5 protein [Colletotrichum truncatum]
MATTVASTFEVESFVSLITSFSADPSYTQLRALVSENAHLKNRNANLTTASEENVRTFAQLQQRIDEGAARTEEKTSELQNALKQAADLAKMLDEVGNEMNDLKSKVKDADEHAAKVMDDFKKKEAELGIATASLSKEKLAVADLESAQKKSSDELEKMRKELGQANTRLSQVDGFTVDMIPSSDEVDSEEWLGNIFESSYSLVQTYFGADLEAKILSDKSCWEAIRNHPSILRLIPLPASNTTTAKYMRIAASLAILARILADYIFRPTYLLYENELSNILSELVKLDQEKERHFRLLLLGTRPDKQRINVDKRVRDVAVEMMKHTGSLLASDQKHNFISDLEDLCQEICSRWTDIQKLEERIEPDFTFGFADELDDWNILQFPTEEELKPAPAQNGVLPVQNGESAQPQGEHHSPAMKKDTAVLWPAFLAFAEGSHELFREGLVLDEALADAARSEEASHTTHGPRRVARLQTRRNSIMRNGSEVGRARAFLSTGAGSPSEGD